MPYQIKVTLPGVCVFLTDPDSALIEGQARALYDLMVAKFPSNEGWKVEAFKVLQVDRVLRDVTEVFNRPVTELEVLTPAPIQRGVI